MFSWQLSESVEASIGVLEGEFMRTVFLLLVIMLIGSAAKAQRL